MTEKQQRLTENKRVKMRQLLRTRSLVNYFVWIFLFLLPFGIVSEFAAIGKGLEGQYPVLAAYFVWLAVPFCGAVSWVFHTMERIGRVGENPFEGSANDVPISTISRGVEIALRQLLDEEKDDIRDQVPEIIMFKCK